MRYDHDLTVTNANDWYGTQSTTTNPQWTSLACRWCGYIHAGQGMCPRIEEIKFYADGVTVKRVRFTGQPVSPTVTVSTVTGGIA